jgi:carbon monoxide dehydrogenase subunit G
LPSSVEAREEILVNSGIMRCFDFFRNLSNIGACIPGCEQVEPIDSSSAKFKVKLKVGYISKTFELKAKLVIIKANEELSFTAESSDAEVNGRVYLSNENNEMTRVRYDLQIKPISAIGRTAISMIGKDLVSKQASEFALCVKKKLEIQAK